jgi:hypothetical protein
MERFPQEQIQLMEDIEYRPIVASIIDSSEIDEQTKKTFLDMEKNGQFIDYFGKNEFYDENNIRNAGERTYVISECNDKSKYSTGYYNCTGIIIVGEKKEDNKQISFMSHQDPKSILSLNDKTEKFNKDLIDSINEIKNKTKQKSLDVIIFGGSYGRDYKNSINALRDIIVKETEVEPTVMTGPSSKVYDRNDDTRVYFDTQKRHLFIARPTQVDYKFNESYLASDLDRKKDDW